MFKEENARAMEEILKVNKYKMTELRMGCVYFIKRYSDDLAFYIRCTDSRYPGGGIFIEMLFSPIDLPDDSLLSLEAGIYMPILMQYEDITDDIIISAGKKVVEIEKNIGNLPNVIMEELSEPYFPNGRISVYKEKLAVYKTVKEDTEIREEFESLIKNEKRMIRSKKTEQAYQLSHEFIEQLPADYFRSKGIDLELSDIKSRFAEHVYAQCVLDA